MCVGLLKNGGQLEIRTLGRLLYTRVPGEHHRPLGQLSIFCGGRYYFGIDILAKLIFNLAKSHTICF